MKAIANIIWYASGVENSFICVIINYYRNSRSTYKYQCTYSKVNTLLYLK